MFPETESGFFFFLVNAQNLGKKIKFGPVNKLTCYAPLASRGGRSPAELVFGAPLRDGRVPLARTPSAAHQETREFLVEKRQHQLEKQEAVQGAGARAPDMAAGDRVDVQDPGSLKWNDQGTVVGIDEDPSDANSHQR